MRTSQVTIQVGAYSGSTSFSVSQTLGTRLISVSVSTILPPAWGMLVILRVTPSIKLAGTHKYTKPDRERQCDSVRVKCRRPGLEPRQLDLKSTNHEQPRSQGFFPASPPSQGKGPGNEVVTMGPPRLYNINPLYTRPQLFKGWITLSTE